MRGGAVDILTGDVPATDLDVCKGEFTTDKILDINEKRILIERTTWCREMAKQRRVGWRITPSNAIERSIARTKSRRERALVLLLHGERDLLNVGLTERVHRRHDVAVAR